MNTLLDINIEHSRAGGLRSRSIDWLLLNAGACQRVGDPDEDELVFHVLGVPDMEMAGMNVALVEWR